MSCSFSAVAVPRRQVDPLAVAPFVEPVPRLVVLVRVRVRVRVRLRVRVRIRVRAGLRVRVGVIGFQPLPRLGAGDGARARPLGLTDLVAPRGVPDLYQAQVLHLVRVRGGVGPPGEGEGRGWGWG